MFADSIKARMPMAVGDFLERYLEFAVLSTRDYDARQRMADDKVTVREGSLGNIPKLSTARDFSLNCFDDRGYEACWTDSLGTVLLRLQFPISLELLMGKPKAEVEKEFKYLLLAEADTVAPIALPDSVCPFDGCCYRSADVTHYFVESLNTATYYTRDGDRWKPVFDDSLKCLSAENLLKGAVDSCAEYRLYIEQNLYGYQQKTYIVKLPGRERQR